MLNDWVKLVIDTTIATLGMAFVWLHQELHWMFGHMDTISQHVLLEGGALLVLVRIIIAARDLLWNRGNPNDWP